jgi:hypothetical protein
MVKIGTRVLFDPFEPMTGFGISMNQGESVLGTVVGIYNLHHWFSVEYYCSGVKQRTSFKPDDIGKRVQVIG